MYEALSYEALSYEASPVSPARPLAYLAKEEIGTRPAWLEKAGSYF